MKELLSRRLFLAVGAAALPAGGALAQKSLLNAACQQDVNFPDRAAAIRVQHDSGITYIRTGGYHSPGDGGGAVYRRVQLEPAHLAKFRSEDGSWWELSEPQIFVEMLGARGDGATDDSTAFAAALSTGQIVKAGRNRRYALKDLCISTNQAIDFGWAAATPARGAKWLIRLEGNGPKLFNLHADDSGGVLVRKTVATGGGRVGTTRIAVGSTTNLDVGMLATILMSNGRWHISPITRISDGEFDVARAFEADCATGAEVHCSWGMVNIRGARRFMIDGLVLANVSFGVVCDADPSAGLSFRNDRGMVSRVKLTGVQHVGWFSGRDSADTQYSMVSIRGGVTHTTATSAAGDRGSVHLPARAWRKSDVIVSVNSLPLQHNVHWNYQSDQAVQFNSSYRPSNGDAISVTVFERGKAGLVIDSTGWRHLRGGDTYSTIEILGFIRGIEMHAKELTSFNQVISDGITGEALYIDACIHNITFGDLFLGYSNQPLRVVGNSRDIHFNGPLHTMRAKKSSVVSESIAFFAVEVESGSTVIINSAGWLSSSDKVRGGEGSYVFRGSLIIPIGHADTFGPGRVAYLGPTGATQDGSAAWIMPAAMRLARLYIAPLVSPGIGEKITCTLRVDGIDTKATATIAGNSKQAEISTDLPIANLSRVCIKIATSDNAAHTSLVGFIELI